MEKKWLPLIMSIVFGLSLACNMPILAAGNLTPPSPDESAMTPTSSSSAETIPTMPIPTPMPSGDSDAGAEPANPDSGTTPERIMDVSANGARSLAIDNTGQVWQWGTLFGPGQACDNPGDCLRQPTRVAGLTGVTAVAAGGTFSLVLKMDGTVWGWGRNDVYQLGQGENASDFYPEPVQIPGLNDIISLAASDTFSLALKQDGSVWAWGHDPMGALGNFETSYSDTPYMNEAVPNQVAGLSEVKAIAVGVSHSAAIDASGQLWTWGNNQQGELGLGSFDTNQHSQPEKVPGMTDVVFVAAGGNNTLAIRADGSGWAWGANYLGQLATGEADFQPHPDPLKIEAFQGAQSGIVSVLDIGVVKPDGVYWSTFGFTQGAPLNGLPAVVKVSGSGNHHLALTSDGQVWAWGENSAGQLGSPITEVTFTPIPVEFSFK